MKRYVSILTNNSAGLPPDPYSFPVPQSDLTVIFYGYGQRLGPARAINELFAEAINDVDRHAAVESSFTGKLETSAI